MCHVLLKRVHPRGGCRRLLILRSLRSLRFPCVISTSTVAVAIAVAVVAVVILDVHHPVVARFTHNEFHREKEEPRYVPQCQTHENGKAPVHHPGPCTCQPSGISRHAQRPHVLRLALGSILDHADTADGRDHNTRVVHHVHDQFRAIHARRILVPLEVDRGHDNGRLEHRQRHVRVPHERFQKPRPPTRRVWDRDHVGARDVPNGPRVPVLRLLGHERLPRALRERAVGPGDFHVRPAQLHVHRVVADMGRGRHQLHLIHHNPKEVRERVCDDLQTEQQGRDVRW